MAQRQAAGRAFSVEAGQIGIGAGAGSPLPDAVRGKMESAMGADFSAVRVHVGPQAGRIGAIAFTTGSDIYFAPGRYQPDTPRGQQLLGHELAHVVQQRAGRVTNPFGSGFAVVQDRALEAEADRLGQRAASHRPLVQAKRETVQRATIQRAIVQRPSIQRPMVQRPTLQRATIQRSQSSTTTTTTTTTSVGEDIYFAFTLTELERQALRRGAQMAVGQAPLHGQFVPNMLSADLHVSAADQGADVSKKLKAALKQIKYYMEYAAAIQGKNVKEAFIEMRPTGGVVVKQMIELLAFVGCSYSEKWKLNDKLTLMKKLRAERIEKAKETIAYLKRERERQLQQSGGRIILDLIGLHPHVAQNPSPGMGQMISDAEALKEKFNRQIRDLKAFIGKRQGESMGAAFFDEHFYMLHTLINKGKPGYFTVTSLGLANDLDEYDIYRTLIPKEDNALLLSNDIGEKARKIYTRRLQEGRASLRIRVYYAAIDDVISTIP